MEDNDIDYESITIDLSDTLTQPITDMAYTTITGPSAWTTATGSAGYVMVSNGTGSTSWNDTITIASDPSLTGKTLTVNGDADISGNLKVGGKDIAESLDRIEERLAILRPNEELEEKWDQLRGLRKAYMELEAEIIEKEKVWSILKK